VASNLKRVLSIFWRSKNVSLVLVRRNVMRQEHVVAAAIFRRFAHAIRARHVAAESAVQRALPLTTLREYHMAGELSPTPGLAVPDLVRAWPLPCRLQTAMVDSFVRHASPKRSFASDAAQAAAPSESPQDGLQVAERAVERLKQLQHQAGGRPVFLRLSVEGGGCSGFQYEFSIDEQGPREGDNIYAAGECSVLCDDVSLEFLRGSTIDFESDLMRSAFIIAENPNAQSSCGCGSSFAAR
jgi:iron-sulfur cluster assembly 2